MAGLSLFHVSIHPGLANHWRMAIANVGRVRLCKVVGQRMNRGLVMKVFSYRCAVELAFAGSLVLGSVVCNAQTAAPALERKPEGEFPKEQITSVMKRLMDHAENWIVVSSSKSSLVFVEIESIRKRGKYTVAWTLYSYRVPSPSRSGKVRRSTRHLEYFDCPESSSAWRELIDYADDIGYGEVVDSVIVDDKEMRFSDSSPGTVGSDVVKFVCKQVSRQKKK